MDQTNYLSMHIDVQTLYEPLAVLYIYNALIIVETSTEVVYNDSASCQLFQTRQSELKFIITHMA